MEKRSLRNIKLRHLAYAGFVILALGLMPACTEGIETSSERRNKTVEIRFTADIDLRFLPQAYRPKDVKPYEPPGEDQRVTIWPRRYPRTLVFNIPGEYFKREVYLKGGHFNYVKLEALLPEMRPRWPKKVLPPNPLFRKKDAAYWQAFEKWEHQKEKEVSITLLNDFSGGKYDQKLRSLSRRRNRVILNDNFHGLRYYRNMRCGDSNIRVNSYAEAQEKGCWFSTPKERPSGYYLSPPLEENRAIDYHCAVRCTANTYYLGFYLSYNFDRSHLPRWCEIDQKVRELLNRFFVSYGTASANDLKHKGLH